MDGAPDYGSSWADSAGPWRASQIQEGEQVELCDGHRIDCMSAGGRHGETHLVGAMVLRSDPAVEHAGVDIGIAFNDGKNLRSPDVSVGVDMSAPGWTEQVPPLAVEYADEYQNEIQLTKKIGELHAIGTRVIWVVRLVGPLRVEVHEPGKPMRLVGAEGTLTAPGILQNPVPVRALVDGSVALETALANLLGRSGYRSLEEVREEGHKAGRKEGHKAGHKEGSEAAHAEALAQLREEVLAEIAERGWILPAPLQARVAAADFTTLLRWLRQCARAGDVEAALR